MSYAIGLKLTLVNGENVSIGLVQRGEIQSYICPDHVIKEAEQIGYFRLTDGLPLGSNQGNPDGPIHPRGLYGDRIEKIYMPAAKEGA